MIFQHQPTFHRHFVHKGYIFILILISLSACTTYPPLEKAKYVDAERFKGSWYVIANIPYFAERNKVASKTTYKHRQGSVYDDIFEARDGDFSSEPKKIKGKARSLNEQNNEWRSTFYWVLNFKFSVIHVDPNYELMLLGHKSRKYGWVMARNPKISQEDYQRALNIFEKRGYDTSNFSKVPQFPEQIGQTGFQQTKK